MNIRRAVIVVALGVSHIAMMWIGVGMGAIEKPDPAPAPKVIREAATEIEQAGNVSTGEIGTAVYTVEMWQDGAVVIRTNQQYIDQLSEHTMLITDRSLDDVRQEILDCMDYPVKRP